MEKQTKAVEYQREKQIKAIEEDEKQLVESDELFKNLLKMILIYIKMVNCWKKQKETINFYLKSYMNLMV